MNNIIEKKSFDFAVKIVGAYQKLCSEKKEFVMSRQILKSGTSIGANVAEAQNAQSKPDFSSKMNIALKETTETNYWLRLLKATQYLDEKVYQSLYADCVELERILTAIVKSCGDEK